MKHGSRSLFLFATALVAGCSIPPVALTTPEPIKVNINMRVDVYQYSDVSKGKKSSKQGGEKGEESAAADTIRSNRRASIQSFKNSQYIGEGHEGLLIVLKTSLGDLGNRVRKEVEAENADRSVEMQSQAQKEKIPISEIQTRQGEVNRIRAFKGEWIEKANPDGTFTWIQKDS